MAACRDTAAGETGAYEPSRHRGDRSMIEPVVHPDTHHSFGASEPVSGIRMHGRWLQCDDVANRDAANRVRTFLGRTLGDWGTPEVLTVRLRSLHVVATEGPSQRLVTSRVAFAL